LEVSVKLHRKYSLEDEGLYETRRGNINFVPVLTKLSVDSAAADSFLVERFLSFYIDKQMPIKKFYGLNPALSNIG